MKYSIRRVNNKSKRVQNTLNRLQKEILPSDKPCDVTIGQWWIVYTDTNKPVAFCGMKNSSTYSDWCFFHRAGVLDEHTGNGLQKRLIKARIRLAKTMGYNYANSDTTRNPASANSLIACGFKSYLPIKPWAWDYSNYWRLKLT